MLSQVISDMKIFWLFLIIVYLGFGEAFLRLSQNSDPDSQYLPNLGFATIYTFRLSVGDTDPSFFNDGTQPVTAWILFIIAVTLTAIIMMNLLIAIISESFETINSNQRSANYQERARMISENSYLIPNLAKKI